MKEIITNVRIQTPCAIRFLAKVNINVVSFMSGVDLLTQMTVHGSSGLQSHSGRSHDDLYIVKMHC